jgi:hypothetical protein
MSLAYWVCAIFTTISAAVSFGYSISSLLRSEGNARIASMYAFARSLALVVVSVIALFTGTVAFVAAAAIAMIVVQAVDTVIGARIRDRMKTFGPAVFAALNLAALIWMLLQ